MPAYETDEERDAGFVGALDEVLQDEPESFQIKAIVTNVEGPVQVQLLPSVSAGSRSWAEIGTTEAQRVANQDPRRRSCTVMSVGENIYVGSTKIEAESGYGVLWPENVPLILTHQDAVYVRSATATTIVSVVVENWAS